MAEEAAAITAYTFLTTVILLVATFLVITVLLGVVIIVLVRKPKRKSKSKEDVKESQDVPTEVRVMTSTEQMNELKAGVEAMEKEAVRIDNVGSFYHVVGNEGDTPAKMKKKRQPLNDVVRSRQNSRSEYIVDEEGESSEESECVVLPTSLQPTQNSLDPTMRSFETRRSLDRTQRSQPGRRSRSLSTWERQQIKDEMTRVMTQLYGGSREQSRTVRPRGSSTRRLSLERSGRRGSRRSSVSRLKLDRSRNDSSADELLNDRRSRKASPPGYGTRIEPRVKSQVSYASTQKSEPKVTLFRKAEKSASKSSRYCGSKTGLKREGDDTKGSESRLLTEPTQYESRRDRSMHSSAKKGSGSRRQNSGSPRSARKNRNNVTSPGGGDVLIDLGSSSETTIWSRQEDEVDDGVVNLNMKSKWSVEAEDY